MADITNPQAIRFCNEQVRPLADKLAQLYYFAKSVGDEFTAIGGTAVVPNTADTVIDGSAVDGRMPITGARVNALLTQTAAILTDWEANSKAKLNAILQVAVNVR